jgi:hypothetical protein
MDKEVSEPYYTALGFFWSEFHDGIAMPLKSTICFFYFQLFFGLFTVCLSRTSVITPPPPPTLPPIFVQRHLHLTPVLASILEQITIRPTL